MADEVDEVLDPETDSGVARLVPPTARLLPIVAVVAAVIWAVSVVVDAWNAWTNGYQGLSGSVPVHTRLQLVVAAIGSTWGYLLVAVVALVAAEWSRAHESC